VTYSLAVKNGDLVAEGSELQIVYGQAKLQQDITLWLLERYGSSRFHPTFGSALQSFIGGVVGSSTRANVYNEIIRVLTHYQTMIYQLFTSNPGIYSLSELPYSIDSVNVNVTYDTVNATVRVSNPASTAVVTISPTSL
jgi:hypothetical protein